MESMKKIDISKSVFGIIAIIAFQFHFGWNLLCFAIFFYCSYDWVYNGGKKGDSSYNGIDVLIFIFGFFYFFTACYGLSSFRGEVFSFDLGFLILSMILIGDVGIYLDSRIVSKRKLLPQGISYYTTYAGLFFSTIVLALIGFIFFSNDIFGLLLGVGIIFLLQCGYLFESVIESYSDVELASFFASYMLIGFVFGLSPSSDFLLEAVNYLGDKAEYEGY